VERHHLDGRASQGLRENRPAHCPFRSQMQSRPQTLYRPRADGDPSRRHSTEPFPLTTGYLLGVDRAKQQIRRIINQAGVVSNKSGPHQFRHLFAVEFIRAGGGASTLQRILGYTTLDMTREYVYRADSELHAAHKKFAPVGCLNQTGALPIYRAPLPSSGASLKRLTRPERFAARVQPTQVAVLTAAVGVSE
jgi:integrase